MLGGWFMAMSAVHVYMLSTQQPAANFAHTSHDEEEKEEEEEERAPRSSQVTDGSSGSGSLLAPPVVLAARNVSYFVPKPGGKKDEELQLLNGVRGSRGGLEGV
eukprot:317052-Prorocentrum_minimum.AAC.1